jgi:hypothetical protein
MKTNMHSPLIIDIVLKAYYSPDFNIDERIPAQVDSAKKLLKDGILQCHIYEGGHQNENAYCYQLTEKGKIFLEMILNTPHPVQKWVAPQ